MWRDFYEVQMVDFMDMLEDIPLSVMAEVMTLVRDYCRYWDEWETDDGFELPEMSTAARIVWNHIKRDLAESNKRYFLNKGKQKR